MYKTKMAKRCSKRRGARVHRRTRRGGMEGEGGEERMAAGVKGGGGGRKKMMRTRRRTRRGGHLVNARLQFGGMSDGKQDAQVIGIRSSL